MSRRWVSTRFRIRNRISVRFESEVARQAGERRLRGRDRGVHLLDRREVHPLRLHARRRVEHRAATSRPAGDLVTADPVPDGRQGGGRGVRGLGELGHRRPPGRHRGRCQAATVPRSDLGPGLRVGPAFGRGRVGRGRLDGPLRPTAQHEDVDEQQDQAADRDADREHLSHVQLADDRRIAPGRGDDGPSDGPQRDAGEERAARRGARTARA